MNPHLGAAMGATMEGYFDNLAQAAMNDQSTLAEMVRAMSNLTKSNEVLTKTNAALTHQLGVLKKVKGSNNPRNPRTGAGVGPPKEMKLCPNCKIEVYHAPSDCFELPANAVKRPRNWVTKVWRCGVTGSVNNSINQKALTSLQLSRTLPASPPPITYAAAMVANTSTAGVDSDRNRLKIGRAVTIT